MYSVAEAARSVARGMDIRPAQQDGGQQPQGPRQARQMVQNQQRIRAGAPAVAQQAAGSFGEAGQTQVVGRLVPMQDTTGQEAQGQPQDKEQLASQLQSALDEIQHKSLKFDVDDTTGRTVIKVIDKQSGEVIKEIPPEEALKLAEKIKEMTGILFDKTA